VTITVVQQVTTGAFFYSYDAPRLYTISPANGPSQGGYLVTLTGLNFGVATAYVLPGSSSIVGSNTQNDSYLVFTMPSGSGLISVSLVANQQTSNNTLPFSYDPPVITALSPSTGPTAGGTSVTVTGNGFGVSGNVRFAGVDLATSVITSYSPSQVIFNSPLGEGNNNAVAIVSLSKVSSTLPFNYTPPYIASMVPANGPPAGGTAITFTGTNFGRLAAGQILINGALCDPSQGGSWGDTIVVCASPAGMGQRLNVTFTVGNQGPLVPPPYFSYDKPTIAIMLPNSGPAAGGNLSILFSGGKKTNKDFLSNCE